MSKILPYKKLPCAGYNASCEVARAHGHLSDAVECFRVALKNMEPRTPEAMEDVEALKSLTDTLNTLEHRMRDQLLRMGTDCDRVLGCKE